MTLRPPGQPIRPRCWRRRGQTLAETRARLLDNHVHAVAERNRNREPSAIVPIHLSPRAVSRPSEHRTVTQIKRVRDEAEITSHSEVQEAERTPRRPLDGHHKKGEGRAPVPSSSRRRETGVAAPRTSPRSLNPSGSKMYFQEVSEKRDRSSPGFLRWREHSQRMVSRGGSEPTRFDCRRHRTR